MVGQTFNPSTWDKEGGRSSELEATLVQKGSSRIARNIQRITVSENKIKQNNQKRMCRVQKVFSNSGQPPLSFCRRTSQSAELEEVYHDRRRK